MSYPSGKHVLPLTLKQKYTIKLLAIGIYAMNPTRFSVRESDQTIEKLTEIHNYFEQGQSEPMQQFIEQYFQCDAKRGYSAIIYNY